jgi:hypothetical protein
MTKNHIHEQAKMESKTLTRHNLSYDHTSTAEQYDDQQE